VSATSIAYSARLPRSSRWFSSVFLKTLRDYRVAVIGWGVGLGLLMIVGAASFPTTADLRLQLKVLAHSITWYNEPIAVDTPGGYVNWRYAPFAGILLSVWALLAASRTLRGEEESGGLDMLLSVPASRARAAVEKVAAIAVALLLDGLLIGLFTALGASTIPNADYGLGASLLLGLDVTLVAFLFAALTLFLSQFTRERGAAAGLAGGILGLSFLLDGIGRVVGSEALRRFSPFYYYGLSKPLVSSYGANPGAMSVLLVGALALAAAAIWLFARRDLGAPALQLTIGGLRVGSSAQQRHVLPARDWTLRSVFARTMRSLATVTFWVTAVITAYGVFATSFTKQVETLTNAYLKDTPFGAILGNGGLGGDADFLALFFSFLVVGPSILALMLATRWATSEENGRLELVFATPQSRTGVLLASFAALTAAVVAVAAVLFAGVWATVAGQGLSVDGVKLAGAIAGMAPIALVVGAVGYLLAGWLPARLLTGVLSLLLVGSFFIGLLGSALKLPDWVLQLSVFQQYGNPLIDGLRWANMLVLLAIAAAALVVATWRFTRKDIGR